MAFPSMPLTGEDCRVMAAHYDVLVKHWLSKASEINSQAKRRNTDPQWAKALDVAANYQGVVTALGKTAESLSAYGH